MRIFLTSLLWFLAFLLNAQEPVFKGSLEDFMGQRIVYPPYAKFHCIQGTVVVTFRLSENGMVREAKVASGGMADLDEEALRVVRMTSGHWQMEKAHDPLANLRLPVNFRITGHGCEQKGVADRAMAIQQYENRLQMEQAIMHYYKNRKEQDQDPGYERRISQLKQELNITEQSLEERVEDGLRKYRQGDVEGACRDFWYVKHMGSVKADAHLKKYCHP